MNAVLADLTFPERLGKGNRLLIFIYSLPPQIVPGYPEGDGDAVGDYEIWSGNPRFARGKAPEAEVAGAVRCASRYAASRGIVVFGSHHIAREWSIREARCNEGKGIVKPACLFLLNTDVEKRMK